MLKRIFSANISNITIAALLVASSSLISRFLGLFRDRILAGEFGAGDTLDIYYAAFRIPDFIFNLLVLGALSAGFIPILTHTFNSSIQKAKDAIGGENEAWRFVNNVLNILFITLIIFCSAVAIFAPWITKIIAPGFSGEKFELVVALTRIMFLSPIFLGISSVFGGVLQSFKCFFIYSLSPILYNLGIIFGVLFFVPIWGVYGFAWGVILGSFLHMAIQVPSAYFLGFRYKFYLNYKSQKIKEVISMMIPRSMSLGISQINLLIITIIASLLPSGSLAIFNFANNLQSFPIGIFGISFAIAAFPTFSAVAFNRKKLVQNFSQTIRQILFFIVPSTVLILTLRAQIVRVILGTGNFGWEDTILTIDTLSFFSISLFAQALIPVLIRIFYARHNSKTPFFVGLVSVAVNVVLSFYLSKTLGVAGLALAFSVASIINFVLLWIILRIELGDMDELKILFSSVKFSVAAIACGITVQGMKLLVWPYIDLSKFSGIFIQGLFAGLFGALVYLAVCSLLRSEEFFYFWKAFKRRFIKNIKKVETQDQGEARGI